MTMRLYLWEGERISTGYHDDATLCVLAETEEQARELALASIPNDEWGPFPKDVWWDANPKLAGSIYGKDMDPLEAIKRPADRVVELDKARVVVFNGGGYD